MSDEAIGAIAIGGLIGVAMTWIVCHYTFLCWKQWQAEHGDDSGEGNGEFFFVHGNRSRKDSE